MLSVVMLSVVRLNVIMLSVVAPPKELATLPNPTLVSMQLLDGGANKIMF